MAASQSLALIGDARAALERARTLSDVKAIRDLAVGAERYAKAKKLGEDSILYAQEIVLRADRRLGEMLRETPKAKGHVKGKAVGGRVVRPPNDAPTLADVGLTKSESSRAQKVADVPESVFEGFIANGRVLTKSRLERLARERRAEAQRAQPTEAISTAGDVEVRHGDLRTALADVADVDAIITDPPYPAQFIDEFDALGELAARILAPTGVLVVMVGQTHLPAYIERLSRHLSYRWTAAYLTDGPATRIHGRKVGTKWKPLLVYDHGNDERKFLTRDVFASAGDDKAHHHWGQAESGFAAIVDALTAPGALVVDPFLGGGTTAIVCRDLGRRFIGCDLDAAAIAATRERLNV